MRRKFFKNIRKCVSMLLAAALCCGCISVLAACNGGGKDPEKDAPKAEYHTADYTLPTATPLADDYRVFPGPEGQTKKKVYYANIDGCTYPEMFLSIALQGIVNREAPELYLIHRYVIQASDPNFNSAQYWFDKLDESYFEEDGKTPYFEKVQINGIADMVLRYADKVKGAVLYHERLVSPDPMAVQTSGANIYGDMAVLNLTSMFCAQKDALPMTEKQLAEVNAILTANGKEELQVVADTREFMLQEEGVFDADRGNLKVWYDCYRYALDQAKSGEWKFNDMCLAHNGTFNAANFDYPIAYKIFNYNRNYEGSTSEEVTKEMAEALEAEIMELTKDNTPVIGVFHLAGDEEPYVRYQNNHGKYNVVTHETWNLTWTCGLPREQAQEKPRNLTYDDSKVYIAMTYSESDNNTYCHFRMPLEYENPNRGKFGMTWAISASCVDLNPNVIKYLNATMAEGDGFATGESGIGYVRNENVLEKYRAGFYGISDVYARYLNGSIRTLLNRLPMSLDYCTYMDHLTAVLGGYSGVSGEGTSEYNSDKANYYFHDKPIFQNLCCTTSEDVKALLNDVHVQGGTFYSIGLFGWAGNFNTLYDAVQSCPDNFVFVSQYELAQLYKQKMSALYNDITAAEFNTNNSNEEISYLWYSNNYENVQQAFIDGQEEYRHGKNDDYAIYRFDLSDKVKTASFTLDMFGEYLVEASEDLKEWTTVVKQDYDETLSKTRRQAKFTLPQELCGKAVYLKITDPTPQDGTGYRVYRMTMTTDQSAAKDISFDTRYDGAYLLSSQSVNDKGYRTGETVYKFPLDKNETAYNLSIEADGKVELYISPDGVNFYERTLIEYSRAGFTGYSNYYYCTLTDIVPALQVKLVSESAIKYVRLNAIQTVKTFDFSPVGCDFDLQSKSLGWGVATRTEGLTSMCQIGNTDVLQYSFRLDKENTAPVLKIFAGGMFKLEISMNGNAWHTLKSVEAGENIDGEQLFDISAYAKPDTVFYLRLTKSISSGGPASVYYLKLEQSV